MTEFIRIVARSFDPDANAQTVTNIREFTPERTAAGKWNAHTIRCFEDIMMLTKEGSVTVTWHRECAVRLPPQPPQSMRSTLALCRMINSYRDNAAEAARKMITEMRTKALDLGEGHHESYAAEIRALGYIVEEY
tara:strand:- start:254 stop:658 length:405 start_codon:yes stop_codon:yes gene_type:complete